MDSFCRAFAHVFWTNLMLVFPLLTLVAMILSSVSLALMAFSHLVLRYCRNVRPTWVKFDSKDTKESEFGFKVLSTKSKKRT